jgi:hypothetical protein
VTRPATGSVVAVLSPLLVAAAGCLDVADGRAARDAHIGVASTDGVAVRVQGGLANVRELRADVIDLWLQAPEVTLDLETPAGAPPVEIIARNVLSDAALAAVAPTDLAITQSTPEAPNEQRWTVVPPAAGGAWSLRIAPPDAADTAPWRFAVLADVQDAIDRVQDIYRRMAEDPSLRFVLFSGDLTGRGTPAQLARFQREMSGLPIPIYATIGNHELGTRDDLFHEFFGRGTFTFVFRNVRFTALDTASATLAPVVYDWLGSWLLDGIDRVHFVFAHIPPLDPTGTRNGAFASRIEANKLVSLLASGKVDTTFYGHIHSYYAFTNGGIPAYISGGGGAIPEQFDGIGRHYLAVDVDPVSAIVQVAVVRID